MPTKVTIRISRGIADDDIKALCTSLEQYYGGRWELNPGAPAPETLGATQDIIVFVLEHTVEPATHAAIGLAVERMFNQLRAKYPKNDKPTAEVSVETEQEPDERVPNDDERA